MSNEEYDTNLEAAVSGTEEVVLLDTVLKQLLEEGNSRGYVVVKTDPSYQKYGFKSLGIAYKKVSDSPSLDDHLAPGDLEIVKNSEPSNTKLAPFIKYASADHRIISEQEMVSILEETHAKTFFLIDNGGGYTFKLEHFKDIPGLKEHPSIDSISADYLKNQGVLKEEELKPYDTRGE